MLAKEKGGQLDNPQGVTQATGLNSPRNITPQKFELQ